MGNWVSYQNGNYTVYFNKNNGTKVRKNNLDFFEPQFPESFDCKLTNSCYHNCRMCHENSVPGGKHGNINHEFFKTLRPHTEIAIGGGNPLEHPQLEEFLIQCKDRELIPSMTVHQQDFIQNIDLLRRYRDEKLIYGLGVSVSHVTDELIRLLKEFPNAVCHIIAGLASEHVVNKLAHNDLKILILGYKMFRRGKDLYSVDHTMIDFGIQYMYDILPQMASEGWFNTISFDNLAIEQLKPHRLMSEKSYEEFFMGGDGEYTMYIDLVREEFAVGSTATERFPLMNNIDDMFKKVREVSKND